MLALRFFLIPLTLATVQTADHNVALSDYANLIADLSIAQQRCSFHVDWRNVASEGGAKNIKGEDIVILNGLISRRIAIIDTSLSDDAAVGDWCNDALLGYGPDGLEVRGLLKP